MSRRLVLITQRVPSVAVSLIRSANPSFDVDIWDHEEPIPQHELEKRLPGADGLLLTLETRLKGYATDACSVPEFTVYSNNQSSCYQRNER